MRFKNSTSRPSTIKWIHGCPNSVSQLHKLTQYKSKSYSKSCVNEVNAVTNGGHKTLVSIHLAPHLASEWIKVFSLI